MQRILLATILLFSFIVCGYANEPDVVSYNDSWGKQGIVLESQNRNNININFSIESFNINEILIEGQSAKSITLPGVFLPNNEGAPDLPGMGRYVAIPQGATATVSIVSSRTETISNIDIAPAFRIPKVYDDGPLVYKKDEAIYSKNAFYPENPVMLSEQMQMRGVDVVILGITPFQYNPVSKELIIYRDLKVEVSFNGGNGQFGDTRLRSRWWDPILRDMLLNEAQLPEVEYFKYSDAKNQDFEYVIIVPDNPDYIAWADSLKQFRTQQGIRTGVFTLTDIGGNNTTTIENWVDNAYNTWTIPPAAVLLMADYGTGPATGNGITSPLHSGFISDNIYACVGSSDYLADIVFARMTAQDNAQLEIMVKKALDYERNPSTNANFYNNPVTAMGYQSDRWFQICSEIINGFFEYELLKQPVRENAGYTNGSAPSSWSTNQNTHMIISHFGSAGLGYIPDTPSHLTDWGANATRLNNDINSGAFLVQHRDHGAENGWSEPHYYTSNQSGLNNSDLPYIFSINCLTGKFNIGGDCFAEAFHRQPKKALGIIAATEVSYSFVNDAYAWGMYDHMWPQFMPTFGTTPSSRGIIPAFANVAGKYFLQQSNWPYNSGSKEVTCYLFHAHGDAFTQLYSEMPQNLTVNHTSVVLAGQSSFSVTADQDAIIALTANGNILGVGTGTGTPVDIQIPPQLPGTFVTVTITKQNYYRYSQEIPVIAANGPYLYVINPVVDDAAGNNNGVAECGEIIDLKLNLTNLGVDAASNIVGTLACTDTMLNVTGGSMTLTNVNISDTLVAGSFSVEINSAAPHLYNCMLNVNIKADSAGVVGGYSWDQTIYLTVREGAKISLDQPGLNYPNTCLTYTSTKQMPITNNGVDTLFITDVTSDISQFSCSQTSLVITPGQQKNIQVGFTPDTVTTYNGTITVINTDPVNYVTTFPVQGDGIFAANLVIADTITHSINSTDSVTITVPVENAGLGELTYNVQVAGYDPNNPGLESSGGSDNYGHMWIDSDMPNGPDFDWVDITGSGTEISLTGSNSISDQIDIGFTFNFYGRNFNKFRVCTNGWISFSTYSIAYNNVPLPSLGAPRSLVAGLWDNLIFQNDSKVYVENQGSRTIILYENIYRTTGEGPYTFQIILYDNENIVLQYLTVNNILDDYTVGIQNYEGNDGLTMAHNENYLHDNLAILISEATWVTVSPMGGTIAPGGTEDLFLTFVTDSLPNGDFWASLNFTSNDPAKEFLIVPIKMTVGTFVGFDGELQTVEGFHLFQNNPNPFNPTTTITYNIPDAGDVELVIYNMLGQKVKTLVNGHQKAQLHRVVWDGTDDHGSHVASGIYVYRLKSMKNIAVKKMIFMK